MRNLLGEVTTGTSTDTTRRDKIRGWCACLWSFGGHFHDCSTAAQRGFNRPHAGCASRSPLALTGAEGTMGAQRGQPARRRLLDSETAANTYGSRTPRTSFIKTIEKNQWAIVSTSAICRSIPAKTRSEPLSP